MFDMGSAVIADRNGTRYWGTVKEIRGKTRVIEYFHSVKSGWKRKRFRVAELRKDKG